jgi:hypothetical protein
MGSGATFLGRINIDVHAPTVARGAVALDELQFDAWLKHRLAPQITTTDEQCIRKLAAGKLQACRNSAQLQMPPYYEVFFYGPFLLFRELQALIMLGWSGHRPIRLSAIVGSLDKIETLIIAARVVFSTSNNVAALAGDCFGLQFRKLISKRRLRQQDCCKRRL